MAGSLGHSQRVRITEKTRSTGSWSRLTPLQTLNRTNVHEHPGDAMVGVDDGVTLDP